MLVTQSSDAHPIVELALRMLRTGTAETYELDAAATRALSAELARITDPSALWTAVMELCTFAGWLAQDKRSPVAAEAVFAAAETAVEALRAIPGSSTMSGDVVAEARAKLIGSNRDLLDPQPAPRGSVPSGPFARFQLNVPK